MKKYLLTSILALSLTMFWACEKDYIKSDSDGTEESGSDDDDGSDGNDSSVNEQESDYVWDAGSVVNITLSGSSISADGEGVDISGSVATITAAGNYKVAGTLSNGQLIVNTEDEGIIRIILNGANITCSSSAPMYVKKAEKVVFVLNSGTQNYLTDGSTYQNVVDNEPNAALFSKCDIAFSGEGALTVKASYADGIATKDGLVIKSGNITVNAADDGIRGKDYFIVHDGTLNVTAAGKGLKSDNENGAGYGYIRIETCTAAITSTGDAISAKTDITVTSGTFTVVASDDGIIADGNVTIHGGAFTVTTSNSKGMGIKAGGSVTVNDCDRLNVTVSGTGSKAIKAAGNVTVAGGTISLKTTGAAFYDTDDSDISSPAGINCDGNFLMEGGSLTLTSSGNGGKGISADGTLVINDGTLTATTTGGQFKYGSDDTAAKALKSTGNLTINGGTVTVKTSGTEAEGIESKATLTINGGTVEVNAYDDCINAKTNITINGGNIYCYSTTNDGIDSNGTMTITGGVIVSSGSTSPEEGFDCDNNTFKITGGTLVGIGGATSTPTSSVTTQRCVVYGGSGTADQLINIQSGGTSILTFKIPRTYSQMTLLFSSSSLSSGTAYTIYKGGSVSGGTNFHGLYFDATYTAGTSASTFTSSSMVTTVGTSSTGGGGRP
ncbi:MAG: carbohydrate-binding domain-containing protein [Breznakibacter sp.]